MTATALLAGLFALLLLRVPVAFALGGLGLAMLVAAGASPLAVPQTVLSTLDGSLLLSVPLFLLMSNTLLKAGVGRDLFAAAHAWVGHWPGGVALATILSCAVFAAVSGSSVATAATIGTAAMPEMISRGYERRFVYGLLAAVGTLGILIPPSIPMIVYGFVTGQPVIDLFLAGIGPGLLLICLFVAFAMLHARRSGVRPGAPAAWNERSQASVRALPSVVLAAVVIGVLYSGAATPTEAAAIGFAGALVVAAGVLRSLSWKGLRDSVFESMATTVAILLVVCGARLFGEAITLYRIPQDIAAFVFDAAFGPLAFLIVVSAVLLLAGLVLEALSMMLIVTLVLLPSALAMGFDPVWFGVYMVVLVECALITPPVGLNLYVVQALARVPFADVARGVLPFLALMLATVLALHAWPGLALHIPHRM
ncbi:TRAP transporter large permease [Polymorphum gilvum]|uniref:TRAP transporter large permease protein n=1 Tax=Polymorphum gilvum (strain LMG 25793 / CGMCC 1.9160 / SL003B-26A1) TaxID=991905 RepID=F2IVV6_POLGS|nr:TRAP transporter large permease subunit [Polymorphum gilvum]ADZ69213.1 TRAP transporter, DctM subunit subfamily [Polymorphum gilvum SL003B-26A1]